VKLYEIMRTSDGQYPVRVMAEMYNVSPSGFYDWRDRPESARKVKQREVDAEVARAFAAENEIVGSRKVYKRLAHQSFKVCRNTVAASMQRNGLKSKAQRHHGFAVTTNSNHSDSIEPNRLNREFKADAPNQKWAADITYVATDEGWGYLAVVMDLFSRKIVGWAVSDTCDEALVIEALNEAIASRKPGKGLLHHSDRGSTYTARKHRQILRQAGIECSMSRKGNCWDNACVERFFGIVKGEWARHTTYENLESLRWSMFQYIETYYNRHRLHQALGYVSPAEYEKRHQEQVAA